MHYLVPKVTIMQWGVGLRAKIGANSYPGIVTIYNPIIMVSGDAISFYHDHHRIIYK